MADAFDVILGVTGFAALVTCIGLWSAKGAEGYYVNRLEIMAIAIVWVAAAAVSHMMLVV